MWRSISLLKESPLKFIPGGCWDVRANAVSSIHEEEVGTDVHRIACPLSANCLKNETMAQAL